MTKSPKQPSVARNERSSAAGARSPSASFPAGAPPEYAVSAVKAVIATLAESGYHLQQSGSYPLADAKADAARIIAEHTEFEVKLLAERATLAEKFRAEDARDHMREVMGWKKRYDGLAKQRDGLLEACKFAKAQIRKGAAKKALPILRAAIAAAEPEGSTDVS